MLTFETEAALLRPFVPRGTELDTHDGRALLSLVGFRFLRTRVLGCRVPFHQDFEEVNLRFYVRREVHGELRRGVTFLREIVPRHLITLVARSAYNEPYVTLRMHSEVPPSPVAAPGRIRYTWKGSAGWQALGLTAVGAPRLPDHGTEHAFVSEHHWGYTRASDRVVRWSIASSTRRGACGSVLMPWCLGIRRHCRAAYLPARSAPRLHRYSWQRDRRYG